MSQITVYSGAGDGRIQNFQSGNWNSVQGAQTGTDADYTATSDVVRSGQDSNFFVTRGYLVFDTSGVPDDATINSAILSIYGGAKRNTSSNADSTVGMGLVQGLQASPLSLTTADFGSVGTVEFASRIAYADWNTAGYNDFSLNASGLANISKTGNSLFALREAYDLDNTQPASGYREFGVIYSETAGTTQDPKLVINYTDNTTTSTTSSTSTTTTSSSTTTTSTSTTMTTNSTSTTSTSTSTTSTTSSTSTTTTSTTTTSSSTSSTSSSTTMPFSIAVDTV